MVEACTASCTITAGIKVWVILSAVIALSLSRKRKA
jgi:hypothetical protein